ncbi:MAG TPA: alpha/beta hydrolase, partial [Chitinophagaceae bacterium]
MISVRDPGMKLKQKIAVEYLRLKLKVLSLFSKKKAAEKAFELFRTPQRRTTKELSKIFKEAERLRFKLEGTVVQGYRWNKGGVKKILIVHGFESSIINFEQYVRPLINKGYEVLAFDAPAHGHSGGEMITAPLFAKMITDIYQKYGPVQSFIAHSFGGLVLSIALEKIQPGDDTKIVFI